jgi:Xaa-Pro aminopeptidase
MKSLNAAHAGMLGKELDGIARKIIEDAGYGQYFGHSLGHGVGRAIHEAPNASPRSEGIFAPGMTVTIEPGIYIPGFGGVRIEDMIVFTNNGFHNFNHSDKKLVVIPA